MMIIICGVTYHWIPSIASIVIDESLSIASIVQCCYSAIFSMVPGVQVDSPPKEENKKSNWTVDPYVLASLLFHTAVISPVEPS